MGCERMGVCFGLFWVLLMPLFAHDLRFCRSARGRVRTGVCAMGLAWVWACGCAGVGVGVGVRSWFWLGIWLIDGGFGRVSGGISLIGGGSVWAIGR